MALPLVWSKYIPLEEHTPLNTFSDEFSELEDSSEYEARREEQADPIILLEKAVKGIFGSEAQVDYRFALTRRNFPAPDAETPDYSATASGAYFYGCSSLRLLDD